MHRILAGLAAFAAFAAAAAAAHAQERPPAAAPYSARCVEEAATGFNWKNGKWVLTNFTRQTFIATKFDKALHKDDINFCEHDKPAGEDVLIDAFAGLNACYAIAVEGEQRAFNWCEEYYEKEGGAWRFDSVHCPGPLTPEMSLKPDGAFVYAMTSGSLEDKPEDDYKDSIKLSHGRCATMK